MRAEALVLPPEDFTLIATGTVATTTACPTGCRGLVIGVAGTINFTMKNGTAKTGMVVPAGVFPGFFQSIESSTATGIWAIT